MRPIVRNRILDRDGHKCLNCGSEQDLHIDHIIPLSRGGRENEENMQVLCRGCNLRKHNSIDIKPYVKIGISPDFICLSNKFPIISFTAKELKLLLKDLWDRNDIIFGG